jgi:hypothetical protein
MLVRRAFSKGLREM